MLPAEVWDHIFSFIPPKEITRNICKLFNSIIDEKYMLLTSKEYPITIEHFGPIKKGTGLSFYIKCVDSNLALKTNGAQFPSPRTIALNYNNDFFQEYSNPIYLRPHPTGKSLQSEGDGSEVITIGKKGRGIPTIHRWNFLTGKQINKPFEISEDAKDYSLVGFSNHHVFFPMGALYTKFLFGKNESQRGHLAPARITSILAEKNKVLFGLETGHIISQKNDSIRKYLLQPTPINSESSLEPSTTAESSTEQSIDPIKTMYKNEGLLFVGTEQGTIRVYCKRKMIWTFKVAEEPRFIARHKDFIFISQGKDVVCWHLKFKMEVGIFRHPEEITGLTLTDNVLATTASDGCLRFWNFEDLYDLKYKDLFEPIKKPGDTGDTKGQNSVELKPSESSQESGDSEGDSSDMKDRNSADLSEMKHGETTQEFVEKDQNSVDLNEMKPRAITPREEPCNLIKFTTTREIATGADYAICSLSNLIIRGNYLLFTKDRDLMVYNLFKVQTRSDNSWLNPMSYLKGFNSRFFK